MDAPLDAPEVIRPVDHPYSKTGGLAVLKGNLAPDGSVVKRSAVVDEMMVHEGPARVFECEEDAIAAIKGGKIVEGDVVVIRYEGPKGGPGMREMLNPTSAIAGMGLGIWMINRTDDFRIAVHCVCNVLSDRLSGYGHTIGIQQTDIFQFFHHCIYTAGFIEILHISRTSRCQMAEVWCLFAEYRLYDRNRKDDRREHCKRSEPQSGSHPSG